MLLPRYRFLLSLTLLVAGLFGVSTASYAQTISYQGYLTNTDGEPAEDPAASLVFQLFDAESGGTEVWSETHEEVAIVTGLFAVHLGSVEALSPSLFDDALWLSVSLNGTTIGARSPLTASPYSLRAASIDEAALEAGTNIAITRSGNALRIDATEGGEPALPAWNLTGNAETVDGQFLGTTDQRPLEIRVNNQPAIHIDPENGVSVANGLTVNAMISSTEGGFQFPDGSIQTTAVEAGGSDGWSLTGNDGITQDNFLGTLGEQPLEFRANNLRVWRATPNNHVTFGNSPNIVMGSDLNVIADNVVGAVILGGGRAEQSGTAQHNVANGHYSVILGGQRNTSTGNYAIVGGLGSVAGGNALALGNTATATALNSVAIGSTTVASSNFSVALGANATATGSRAVALGNTTASGNNSVAIGFSTNAIGTASTAMNHFTNAAGVRSTAMGGFTIAQAHTSLAIGQYNIASGTPGTWIATEPLLVAGNGTSDAARSNALTLLKNGDLTIAGTLTQNSDERLKENIRAYEQGLEAILGLNPVRYQFRTNNGRPDGEHIGLLAQDVLKILPELVREGEDGYLSVSYANLTAVLIGAVHELNDRIDQLTVENEELRALAADAASLYARIEAQDALLQTILRHLGVEDAETTEYITEQR